MKPTHTFGKLLGKPDTRYTVEASYTGQVNPQYIVRFCGQSIGTADTKPDAWQLARQHKQKRDKTL